MVNNIGNKLLIIQIFILTALLYLLMAPYAGAFSLPILIPPVNNFLLPSPSPASVSDLSLVPEITLTSDGDFNKNGQVDAGDMVTFKFTISNPTNNNYLNSTLKTNIQRDSINFIHNLIGITGIDDNNKFIEIPNISLNSKQRMIASFEARINYYTNQDVDISSEPELVDHDSKSVLKAAKINIKVHKITEDQIPLNGTVKLKNR